MAAIILTTTRMSEGKHMKIHGFLSNLNLVHKCLIIHPKEKLPPFCKN